MIKLSPKSLPLAIFVTLSGKFVTALPSLKTNAIPLATLIMASVTMNDGILTLTDNNPFINPTKAPTIKPIPKAI